MNPKTSFEATTGISLGAVTAIPPQTIEFLLSLKIPDRLWGKMGALNEWESDAATMCTAFIVSKRIQDNEMAEVLARKIGNLLAEELLKGNFKAPRIVSEGLLNIQNKKPFKSRAGRKPSSDKLLVITCFYYLKSTGIGQPSQREVSEYLTRQGHSIKPDHLSKMFDELDLRSLSSDARMATSDAGRRKRQKK